MVQQYRRAKANGADEYVEDQRAQEPPSVKALLFGLPKGILVAVLVFGVSTALPLTSWLISLVLSGYSARLVKVEKHVTDTEAPVTGGYARLASVEQNQEHMAAEVRVLNQRVETLTGEVVKSRRDQLNLSLWLAIQAGDTARAKQVRGELEKLGDE